MPRLSLSSRTARVALAAGAVVAGAAALVPATAGSSVAPTFSKAVALTKYAGGEPSLAIDPKDPRAIYVTAPQGIGALANNTIGKVAGINYADKGVGFWASHDGGKTFPIVSNIGSYTGGGDSDVEVDLQHRVYVADLEASAASICYSDNGGKTFADGGVAASGNCSGVATNQQGPENDRQWLNHGPNGEMYLTYHDFSAGVPVIERSDDRGKTWAPCGTILDPQGPAGQNYSPTNGTLVAKPAIDRTGRIYVEVTEPSLVSPPVGATLGNLYIAVGQGGAAGQTGCNGSVFANHLIYSDPGADLAKIFDGVTVDGAGNVYVIADGITKAGQKTNNVWMFVSRDKGVHWTAPIRVNTPDLKANAMPAIVGGKSAGEVAIGWYGTSTSGDPNTLTNVWRYYASTSFDFGKSFHQTTVTAKPIHYGDICTQGLFCGLNPLAAGGNRNLADFNSLAVDPTTGQLVIAFPGDPYNRPDVGGANDFSSTAFVVRQTGGRPLN